MADISFRWIAEDTPGPTALRFGDPLSGPQAQIRVVGPLGTPQALAFKTLDRRAQIEVVGPLGAPQALAYSTLMRKADLSVTGPLGTPTFLFKGTNLVEILGIVVEWNYSDWAFDLSFEWRFAGTEDDFTGELTYTGAMVIGAVEIPFSTTETHYTFGGIPPEVAWELDVRAGLDGPTRTVSGVTTREVPDQVTGINYTGTISSLTFTWTPSARADEYRARLYRDGALVDEEIVLTEEVTFTGLEDGTVYVAEVSGVNETGPGFAGTRTAITVYIPPTAATNLRQTDQNYVAVVVEWDAPPEKVTFWESEVYIAEPYQRIHRNILPPEPLEKWYGLPTAGKTYQWRIRAGNPGGLSAWAEIDIKSVSLLIDSRLAMLPAAYQEDYLFPDTWDGGTDFIAEGIGDPQNIFGSAIFNLGESQNYLFVETGESRLQVNAGFQTAETMILNFGSDAGESSLQINADFSTADAFILSSGSDAAESTLRINAEFAMETKMFLYYDQDAGETSLSVTASFFFEDNL